MIINKNDEKSISVTSEILKKGGIVILPTDTVYGFSGITDAKDFDSNSQKNLFETDRKIREIKGRAETKPLIQLIAEPKDIFLYTNDKIPENLLSKWPGSLSIIVHLKPELPMAKRQPTVAFRCPGDDWLRKIISECELPIFSTSVNRSGEPVLDEENKIVSEFENDCDLIVLDGDKKNAYPSTLVSIENDEIKILRQGSVKI